MTEVEVEVEVARKGQGMGQGRDYTTSTGGKSMVQMQAEVLAESRFTDMMASAGVGGAEMRMELMQWVPRDFRDEYVGLVTRALKDSDGGTDGRGAGMASKGALGKAGGKGAKTTGRKYKKYWTVQDERALQLKDRIDKRLRMMAREIRAELAGLEVDSQGSGGAGAGVVSCTGCGRIVGSTARFCSECGREVVRG